MSAGLALTNRYITLRSSKIVTLDLRADLLQKLYSFSKHFYDRRDRSRLHAMIVQDSERVDVMANALAAQLLPATCTATVIGLVLFYLNPTLAVVLAAVSPLIVVMNRWFHPVLSKSTQRFRKSFEAFSSGVLFVVDTIDLTRVQRAEEFELKRQTETLDDLRRKSAHISWLRTAYDVAQLNVSIIGSVVILVGGGYAVANGAMSLGELMSFYVVVGLLRSQVTTAASAVPSVVLGAQSLAELDGLLDQHEEHQYRGRGAVPCKGRFALRNVRFDYGREPVLEDVSLELSPGRHVAIVGPNGCGKSTLIHLLCGFYRPLSGSVFAEDRPYDDLDVGELRRSMAVVQQNPVFFSGSILENVAYGDLNPDREAIALACRRATASEFIESLADGYDTQIGDDGVRLSGGQRQRLAIARALYRQPRLLILDEPTNHLDVHSITVLLSNLRKDEAGPTTLIVSHDYRVVSQADEVYGLEGGRLQNLDGDELARWVSLIHGGEGRQEVQHDA